MGRLALNLIVNTVVRGSQHYRDILMDPLWIMHDDTFKWKFFSHTIINNVASCSLMQHACGFTHVCDHNILLEEEE